MEFTNSLFYNKADASESTYYKGAAQIQYPIRNLTWETTETYDIGVDARFFDGRLSFVGDYYYKRTKDMLLDLEIPKYMGYSNPSQNAGKMHTRGYDLELSWNDRIGEFTYGISANLSDYISKMDDLSGTQFMGDRVKMTGSLFDEWYGYISEGLFQTQEELDKSATLNSNTQVGDVKYKDISGPEVCLMALSLPNMTVFFLAIHSPALCMVEHCRLLIKALTLVLLSKALVSKRYVCTLRWFNLIITSGEVFLLL